MNKNTEKDNYVPISILPSTSKIHERCLYNQMQQQNLREIFI